MTDSTLSLTYADLMDEIAYFLFGKAADDLTDDQEAVCDRVVNAGYRQFLYPPAIDGIRPGYEWSFLQPTTTITTEETEEGSGIYLADQDLPDDFGRLIDGFTFEADAQVPPVLADVGEGKIRRLRAQFDETSRPRVAGIRIKASDYTEGQRREVLWYPRPDAEYTLSYRYEALVDKLTALADYPLGAMKHAETLRLSCLAMADARVNDAYGVHWDNFSRAIVASVARDIREGAKFFGQVGAQGQYESMKSDVADYPYTLTVSGVEIE